MTFDEAAKNLEQWVQPDGGLACDNPYVDWRPGVDSIILDGEFTSGELEAIAAYVTQSEPSDLGEPDDHPSNRP